MRSRPKETYTQDSTSIGIFTNSKISYLMVINEVVGNKSNIHSPTSYAFQTVKRGVADESKRTNMIATLVTQPI